jgi:hypothetical protein
MHRTLLYVQPTQAMSTSRTGNWANVLRKAQLTAFSDWDTTDPIDTLSLRLSCAYALQRLPASDNLISPTNPTYQSDLAAKLHSHLNFTRDPGTPSTYTVSPVEDSAMSLGTFVIDNDRPYVTFHGNTAANCIASLCKHHWGELTPHIITAAMQIHAQSQRTEIGNAAIHAALARVIVARSDYHARLGQHYNNKTVSAWGASDASTIFDHCSYDGHEWSLRLTLHWVTEQYATCFWAAKTTPNPNVHFAQKRYLINPLKSPVTKTTLWEVAGRINNHPIPTFYCHPPTIGGPDAIVYTTSDELEWKLTEITCTTAENLYTLTTTSDIAQCSLEDALLLKTDNKKVLTLAYKSSSGYTILEIIDELMRLVRLRRQHHTFTCKGTSSYPPVGGSVCEVTVKPANVLRIAFEMTSQMPQAAKHVQTAVYRLFAHCTPVITTKTVNRNQTLHMQVALASIVYSEHTIQTYIDVLHNYLRATKCVGQKTITTHEGPLQPFDVLHRRMKKDPTIQYKGVASTSKVNVGVHIPDTVDTVVANIIDTVFSALIPRANLLPKDCLIDVKKLKFEFWQAVRTMKDYQPNMTPCFPDIRRGKLCKVKSVVTDITPTQTHATFSEQFANSAWKPTEKLLTLALLPNLEKAIQTTAAFEHVAKMYEPSTPIHITSQKDAFIAEKNEWDKLGPDLQTKWALLIKHVWACPMANQNSCQTDQRVHNSDTVDYDVRRGMLRVKLGLPPIYKALQ